MLDLAIVGGGPGGLMSAWYLKKKLGDLCRVTIYEASDRVGGKIVSRKFDSAPAMYEAGVAEIYDYSMTGPDPLRELIQHFGLQTIPMDAEQVQLDGELLNDVPGMRRKYGAKTAAAIEAFRKRCSDMVSPIEYYEGVGAHDNEHPWAYMTCEEVLDKEVDDPTAKRFLKVMARSDIATESHNTNGLNALKNFVMDIDGYIGLYSIQNGNEQLIECLRSEVDADIQLNHRVLKVGKTDCWPLPAQHDERQGAGDAGFRSRADVPAAFLARHHALGWRRAAQVDGQARRLFRPAGALSAGLDPVRRAVLGREDPGRLVHVGSVRRLLRLQRRRAPRRRQARRAELADRRLRRAGVRQSQRPGTDRRRAEIAAGLVRQRPRPFPGRQDPPLAVVGECAAGRPAGARRHDQPSARAEAASGNRRGRRLSVRFDAERSARLLRCRHRHHSHRDDAAAPRPRAGRARRRPTRSTAAISRITAASAPTAKSGAGLPIRPI